MLTASMSVQLFESMNSSQQFLVFNCVFIFSLVVEIDLPWDDRQVESLGQESKAWSELEFEAAILAVKDACAFSELAYVVISSSWITLLGVP